MKKKNPNNTRGKQIHLLPVLKVNVQQSYADPDFFFGGGGGGPKNILVCQGNPMHIFGNFTICENLKKLSFPGGGMVQTPPHPAP